MVDHKYKLLLELFVLQDWRWKNTTRGKMSSPGRDPSLRRKWCFFYRLAELPKCPWHLDRMA